MTLLCILSAVATVEAAVVVVSAAEQCEGVVGGTTLRIGMAAGHDGLKLKRNVEGPFREGLLCARGRAPKRENPFHRYPGYAGIVGLAS